MAQTSHSGLAVLVLTLSAGGCSGDSSTGGASDASPHDASTGRDGAKGDAGMVCDIPECLRPYNCSHPTEYLMVSLNDSPSAYGELHGSGSGHPLPDHLSHSSVVAPLRSP